MTRPWLVPLLLASLSAMPAAAQEKAAAAPRGVDPRLLSGLVYRPLGPSRGGRVTAVAGHRAQPNTFWFGSTGGGVWKTTDAGVTWQNIGDRFFAVGSIGAVEVAESNPEIIYVGTGSGAIRSNVSIGDGVYRTSDGGRTWQHVGLARVGVIGDMAVDPANPDRVFVAALGNPFAPNPERGIFRSLDGGATWKRVLFVSDSTGASDIALNPSNPDELYAGMWRAERKPWTIISGAAEGGVYKSTDGGSSWQKLADGLPTGLTGKISLSVARSNPSRVYALIEAGDSTLGVPGGVHGGVYRSDDAGATWTRTSNQAGLLNRPFYYTYIDADPQNPDMVYVNNEGFFKSTDGGKTFLRMATPHGDNHGMWINPDHPEIFIQSNDGGANVTLDGGRTWSTQLNQNTAELYQVDVDDRWPYWIYAGQQDESTIGVPSTGEGLTSPQAWRPDVGGCETGPAVPQPGSNGRIIFSNCKGRFYRWSELTGQATEYSVGASNMYGHDPEDLKYRFQRVSPIVVSPHDPNVVYHASQYLHRTTDGGRTWETISPDLTANDPRYQVVSGWPISRDITGEEFYSTLYTVAESPLERGVIWTGANDGPISLTRDNGATWARVTPKGLAPGGRVQWIEASPHRQGSAYASVLRYMFDDWKPYLFRTDDYGATWTLLTGPASGFPQREPARVVREDPGREGLLYAGTEYGAYVSFDNGRGWQGLQLNLPHTPVTDMKVYRGDLILSTQGRGFWILDDVNVLQRLAAARPDSAYLFEPRPLHRGAPRGDETAIRFFLPTVPEGGVTLEVLDPGGAVIRTINSSAGRSDTAAAAAPRGEDEMGGGVRVPPNRLTADAGINTYVWDLRREGGVSVAPGRYTARLRMGDTTIGTVPLEVRLHPRLVADGITTADLQAQYDLGVQVQQLAADARMLQQDLRTAREAARKAGNGALGLQLDAIDARLNTRTAQSYPQPMLIGQIQYLNGIVNRGDNRPGRDSLQRAAELRTQLEALRAALNEPMR